MTFHFSPAPLSSKQTRSLSLQWCHQVAVQTPNQAEQQNIFWCASLLLSLIPLVTTAPPSGQQEETVAGQKPAGCSLKSFVLLCCSSLRFLADDTETFSPR